MMMGNGLNQALFSFDYNNNLERNKINKQKMMNQNCMQQYYILYALTEDYQTVPVFVCPQQYIQTQRLKLEKNTLIGEIQSQSEQRERIEVHNVQLRDLLQGDGARNKRRYRKRRTWLDKKYRCNIKGCSNKYSSKIALNSHKRKKHPKKPKAMI